MKIKDLSEHLSVKTKSQNFWISSTNKSLLLDKGSLLPVPLKMSYGEFAIREYAESTNNRWFGVFDQNDTLLCIAEIQKVDPNIFAAYNMYHLSKIERDKTQQSLDMPMALVHYLVQDQKLLLLSDKVMNQHGNRFWAQIIERGQIGVFVVDLDTGLRYMPTPGEQYSTIDGAKILLPRDDRKFDLFKDGTERPRNHYRFFYLAQGGGSHYLTEDFETRQHSRFPETASWVLFGEQDYHDYQE